MFKGHRFEYQSVLVLGVQKEQENTIRCNRYEIRKGAALRIILVNNVTHYLSHAEIGS